MTVTKIVNDLERIGDEAKKIAYKAAHGRAASSRLRSVRSHDVARDGRARAGRCCAWRWTRSRASTPTRAAEVVDSDEEIDAAFARSCASSSPT